MQLADFQRAQWIKFFSQGIKELCSSHNFFYEGFDVKFSADGSKFLRSHDIDSAREITDMLSVNVSIKNTNASDSESISAIESIEVPIAKIPLFTEYGFALGVDYFALSTSRIASGWYLYLDKKLSKKFLLLKKVGTVKLRAYTSRKGVVLISSGVTQANGQQVTLTLLEFLKATSKYGKTFKDIISDFRGIPKIYEQYILAGGVEPSMTECAEKVCQVLGISLHMEDPVKAVQTWLFESQYLNVGAERVPRFKNFMSFSRGEGYALAKDVTFNGITYHKGETLTRRMATELDDANVDKIFILYKNASVELFKINVQNVVTPEEIECALYYYCLWLDGLGSADKQDHLCNKVLAAGVETIELEIDKQLTAIVRHIRRNIRSTDTKTEVVFGRGFNNLNTDVVISAIKSQPNFHPDDQTNSLAHWEQTFRVTTTTNSDAVPMGRREVQASQINRICPYYTSESANVGLFTSLTSFSKIDAYGFLTASYLPVKNGVAGKEPLDISAVQERGHIVASYDVDLSKERTPEELKEICHGCRLDGDIVEATYGEIAYQEISPAQVVSPLIGYIPAACHNNGKRLVMGANTLKQALPTWIRDRPWVATGIEAATDIGVIKIRDIIKYALSYEGYFDETVDDSATATFTGMYNRGYTTTYVFETMYPKLLAKAPEQQSQSMMLEPMQKQQRPYYIGYTVRNLSTNTKNSSTFHYNLALKLNTTYNADDIAFYANDISTETRKLSDSKVSLGKLELSTEHLQKHCVALGQNLTVMFRTFEGYNYEDGIVINRDFVNMYGLSIQRFKRIKCELAENGVFSNNIPDTTIGSLWYLNANGLPRVGTELKPGMLAIGQYTTLDSDSLPGDKDLEENQRKRNRSEYVSIGDEGTVISADIIEGNGSTTPTIAEVVIGEILPVNIGDKLSAEHGNKGVVGKIADAFDLPFTADGKIPDIIFNVLGGISRANYGQYIEAAMGALGAATKTVQLLSPFTPSDMHEIAEQLKASGLEEVDTYDGKTGKKFSQKSFIGSIYVVRSEHIATSKFNACADARNNLQQRTGQPVRGSGGGQRLSEMGTWCLDSYPAPRVADTLMSIQSDDIEGHSQLLNSIATKDFKDWEPFKFNLNNAGILEAYFRQLGVNIESNGKSTKLTPINSERAKQIRKDPLIISAADHLSALHSESYFGAYSHRAADFEASRKTYGRYQFGEDLIMPLFLEQAQFLKLFLATFIDKNQKRSKPEDPEVVEKTVFLSCSLYYKIIANKYHYVGYEGKKYPRYIADDCVELLGKDRLKLKAYSGTYGIIQMIKQYNLDNTREYLERSLSLLVGNENYAKQMFDFGEVPEELKATPDMVKALYKELSNGGDKVKTILVAYKNLREFQRNWTLSDYFTDSLIIAPIGFRPQYHDKSTTALDAQVNTVIAACMTMQAYNPGTSGRCSSFNYMYSLLDHMLDNNKAADKDNQNKSVFQELYDHSTKHAIVRDTIEAKRIRYSGRSVIAVSPDLKIDEIGIPIIMASEIFINHIVREFPKHEVFNDLFMQGMQAKYSDLLGTSQGAVSAGPARIKKCVSCLVNKNIREFRDFMPPETPTHAIYEEFNLCYKELVKILAKIFEDFPILAERAPDLLKFSITAFKAIPVEGYAILLHPMSCMRYNADFDGDQMAVYAPQDPLAIKEVNERMLMSKNMVNPKNGEIIINVNQDMILGLYWCTIYNNNADPATFDISTQPIAGYYFGHYTPYSKSETFHPYDAWRAEYVKDLLIDLNIGTIKPQDIVVFDLDGQQYRSTAGRIVFNSLLPCRVCFTNERDPATGFYKLKYDVAISGSQFKHVAAYAQQVENEMDTHEELKDFYDRIKAIGFLMADQSGITLSVFDFIRMDMSKFLKPEIDKCTARVSEIQKMYDDGWLSESERKRNSILVWQELKPLAERFFAESDRNSALFMIIDSEARGSKSNIVEACGIIGNVVKSNNDMIEVPILGNYMTGLSASDAFRNAYSARVAISAGQLTTKHTGEITRKLIYLNDHAHIEQGKCSAKPTRIKLHYTTTFDVDTFDRLYLGTDVTFSNESAKAAWDSFKSEYVKATPSTLLNDAARFQITENLIPEIPIIHKDGSTSTVRLTYSLDKTSKDMLWYRSYEPTSLPADLREAFQKTEMAGYPVVNKKTLELIDSLKLTEFFIYTILGCKDSASICPRCYGFAYDMPATKIGYPAKDTYVGYQCVQAQGEPITQMVLNSHRKTSGESVGVDGLASFELALGGADTGPKNPQLLASVEGIVHIWAVTATECNIYIQPTDASGAPNGKQILAYGGVALKDCAVAINQKVYPGDCLTKLAPSLNTFAEVGGLLPMQMQLWRKLTLAFTDILPRNSEIIVKSLTEFGVAGCTQDDFNIGEIYPIRDLEAAKVPYTSQKVDLNTAINKSNKPLAAIALGESREGMSVATLHGVIDNGASRINKVLLGIPMSERRLVSVGDLSVSARTGGVMTKESTGSGKIYKAIKQTLATLDRTPTTEKPVSLGLSIMDILSGAGTTNEVPEPMEEPTKPEVTKPEVKKQPDKQPADTTKEKVDETHGQTTSLF